MSHKVITKFGLSTVLGSVFEDVPSGSQEHLLIAMILRWWWTDFMQTFSLGETLVAH
jgi:hypothetical protein